MDLLNINDMEQPDIEMSYRVMDYVLSIEKVFVDVSWKNTNMCTWMVKNKEIVRYTTNIYT